MSLSVTNLSGFGAGGPGAVTPISGGYRNTYINTASATNYSFSSCDIGTAAANRHIVVVIDHGGTADGFGPSSVTVAGQSCSQLYEAPVDERLEVWITDSPVTSGTTGTIAVNHGGNQSWCRIAVYAFYDVDNTAAYASVTSTSNSATLDVNTVDGGAVVGMSYAFRSTGTVTVAWTGLTEEYDAVVDGNNYGSSASELITTGETPRTITCAYTGSGASGFRAIAVSLSPA